MRTLDQILDYLASERSYVAAQLDNAKAANAEYWGARFIEIATIQHAILETPHTELAEAIAFAHRVVASK